jgi:hypothetical protein
MNIGSKEAYWNFMTDVVAPVVAALSNADAAMKVKIKSEVLVYYNLIDQIEIPSG